MVATAFPAAAARAARPRVRRPESPAQSAAAPRLTVVARPQPRRSIMPFALVCTAIIALTLGAILMLNISMSDTSYRITRLTMQSRALDDRAQSLKEQGEQLATPQELARRAGALGMVPAAQPAYIDLATGSIVGTPTAAAGPAGAAPATAPTTTPPAATPHPSYFGMGGEPR